MPLPLGKPQRRQDSRKTQPWLVTQPPTQSNLSLSAPPPTGSAIPGVPVLVHAPHFLLTIYNGGHSLADAGAIMQLRIKESGLQKTQGSSVQPCTPIGPPHRLDRALET